MIEVLEPGPLATVQDLGRPGLAALGVGRAGAADPAALRLANRLVGNVEGAAGIEATLGGLSVRVEADVTAALAGAPCPAAVGSRPVAPYAPFHLAAGDALRLGTPSSGLRSYLAVRGGVAVPAVLGSRSTDCFAGLGHPPLRSGDRLPLGTATASPPVVDLAPQPRPAAQRVLRVLPGPRVDWLAEGSFQALCAATWRVSADADRVGIRLEGPALRRQRREELPSEGMVAGAIQASPDGRPALLLVEHPVTGGYPVLAVVIGADLAAAAQCRPGESLRFSAATGAC